MERGSGHSKRRGMLPRSRGQAGTSAEVAIRRRERTESSSGNEDRETMEGRDLSPPYAEGQSQMKPPVILMKPQRSRKNNDDDEEWPTVGRPVSVVSSRTATPIRRVDGASSGPEDASGDKPDYPTASSSRGPRRQGSYRSEGVSGSTVHYQIQQKPQTGYSAVDSGPETILGGMGSRPLRGGIRLITEAMEWSEAAVEFLQDQSNFLVVGVVGPQGVGKSTILSMIGGNDPFDMYRQYIFRQASKECTETGGRQTAGIQFFVNDDRIILLDSQPVLSHAIMEQMNQTDRRFNYEYRMTENCMEIESLQIASYMMQVCHVVIFLVDWFVDVDLLRFVQTAEMLKPSLPISENPQGDDHYPHFVFVQNRGRREDFTLLSIKEKCTVLNGVFGKSSLLTKDGVSLKNSSYDIYEELKDDCGATNFFVLPDMKPRGYKQESVTWYKGIPDFEVLVRDLRKQVMALSRPSFGPTVQTEKNWFHMAARTWDMTRKSLLISEYGRMLP